MNAKVSVKVDWLVHQAKMGELKLSELSGQLRLRQLGWSNKVEPSMGCTRLSSVWKTKLIALLC